jgi:hypothetical protein
MKNLLRISLLIILIGIAEVACSNIVFLDEAPCQLTQQDTNAILSIYGQDILDQVQGIIYTGVAIFDEGGCYDPVDNHIVIDTVHGTDSSSVNQTYLIIHEVCHWVQTHYGLSFPNEQQAYNMEDYYGHITFNDLPLNRHWGNFEYNPDLVKQICQTVGKPYLAN